MVYPSQCRMGRAKITHNYSNCWHLICTYDIVLEMLSATVVLQTEILCSESKNSNGLDYDVIVPNFTSVTPVRQNVAPIFSVYILVREFPRIPSTGFCEGVYNARALAARAV